MTPLGETAETSFATRMRDLEQKFAAAAARDGDVYLRNFTPAGPVDAVFIGMEPSLSGRSPAETVARTAAGYRNFMWSPEDFILHYAARRSLCSTGETYHVTDISKGAMAVTKAQADRHARYARWAGLLEEELSLIAKPGAHLIALGQDARSCMEDHGLASGVTTILHYSGQAGAARNAAVVGREIEFRAFAERLSMHDIIDVAAELIRDHSIPDVPAAATIARLRNATLTESRKKLAFIYSTAFAELRAT